MNEFKMIAEMVRRYNNGEISLSDQQAQKLAEMAFRYDIPFEVGSKPIRKGMFDAADMATFGMLPNEWRPRSPGEGLYGESTIDRFAGGAGSLLGLAGGVGAGIKGARTLYGAATGGKAAAALARVKEAEALKRSKELAATMYNKGANYTTDAASRAVEFGSSLSPVLGRNLRNLVPGYGRVAEKASDAAEWWTGIGSP